MFDAYGDVIHFTDRRTVDAAVEPITLDDFKSANRIDQPDEDEFVEACLKVARDVVEARTGRALISQTRTMTLDQAPACGEPIVLPMAPVSSVTSVTAYATDDTPSTVATSVYRLDTESIPARLVLKDGQEWPTCLRPQNAISIVYVAGYGTASTDIGDDGLVQAVRMLAAHFYKQREPVVVGTIATEIPFTVAALIDRLRVPWY